MVNIVLTFDLPRWPLICLVFLLMFGFIFLCSLFCVVSVSFSFVALLLLICFLVVCVCFLSIFCGLWFLFWLWFSLAFGGFRVMWAPHQPTPSLFWEGCFFVLLMGFCLGFVATDPPDQQTNKTNKNKNPCFPCFWAVWGRGLAKEKPPKMKKFPQPSFLGFI